MLVNSLCDDVVFKLNGSDAWSVKAASHWKDASAIAEATRRTVRSRIDSPMVRKGLKFFSVVPVPGSHPSLLNWPEHTTMASDERVTLNVSGTRFEIPRRTLARFPDSLLGPLSIPGGETELVREPNGEYFFDRCVIRV